ncbi:hypothetical protein DL96DRAFT_1718490 [Flagelloscypha sp. PMI_526]|nr:hypothetical protein DL96DRAFT_1718490 [Flagelloscypha sp. PMI_526]
MSPEGHNMELTLDMWMPGTGDARALLTILFTIVTGRPPFELAHEPNNGYAAFYENNDFLWKTFCIADHFSELCQ